ncbi:MAG TPA: VOC family protein [Acidimicrobiales bacterium]|nr:VOC family protein [Acidimicrobiales bacterium]
MRAADQFHAGIVVDDFEATLEQLSELFGYVWGQEIRTPVPVRLPTGEELLDMGLVYSLTLPRLEIVRSIPGTLWTAPPGSSVHHLGYWSDDIEADSARLAENGYLNEAVGCDGDGNPYWAYHKSSTGPRIELVSRALEPALQGYWDTGRIG